MRRIVSALAAALPFLALAAALSLPGPTRVVRAADTASDINERCIDCQLRAEQQFERCQAKFGLDVRCDEQFNRDIVNCFREFCEQ
jgi:hypothetical protein